VPSAGERPLASESPAIYSGAAANSSGFTDFDGVLRSPGPAIRVRSLGTGTSSANVTRDYFITDIPMDGFNTDRVEVNRGPNAMLFGLGSPQGIVNSGLLKPQLRRDHTRVETQFGRFGTYRTSLDTNRVVRRDLFALRFAALYWQTEYMQEPVSSRA
jgi:outer membrane receptor protein involved in Fe transport